MHKGRGPKRCAHRCMLCMLVLRDAAASVELLLVVATMRPFGLQSDTDTYTQSDEGAHGLCRYIFLLGMLMSQFTITGFDACGGVTCCSIRCTTVAHAWRLLGKPSGLCGMRAGHMSEETRNADVSAAWGIVIAILTSAACGMGYILALCFAIQVCLRASPLTTSPRDSTSPGRGPMLR